MAPTRPEPKGWAEIPLPPAAQKGVKWLVLGQQPSGGWGANGLGVRKGGREPADPGNTSMATLAILGTGSTPGKGTFQGPIERAVRYVLARVEISSSSGLHLGPATGPRRNTQIQTKIGRYADTFLAARMQSNKAGEAPGGTGYAGYGSTTADGVLSLRAVGAPPTDERVRRARDWLVAHHRTDRVPGFPREQEDEWALSMVFYYRAAAARAFRWLDVRDAPAGHGWRSKLASALSREQARDGSFRNLGTLMKEDDPLIATSFAIQALAVMR